MALREELVDGSVESISELPKIESFSIKIKPTIERETLFRICEKLKCMGYIMEFSSPGRSFRRLFPLPFLIMNRRYEFIDRCPRKIIATKVNSPNIPKNPHELSDPEGEKPKKNGSKE